MSALFWLLRRSFRNWLVRKITRLKQPKYALSAVFLGLYLCVVLLPWAVGSVGGKKDAGSAPLDRAILEALVTGFVLLSVVWSWLSGTHGALAFTMPEAVSLFPAPVSRRALLLMKIARTQLPLLVSATFFTYASRSFTDAPRAQILVTNFLFLNALFLNRLVAALAQCPRPATGKPHVLARVGKAIAALVVAAVAASFRPFSFEPEAGPMLAALAEWASRAPARYALAPLRSFAGPALARTPDELLRALMAPVGIVLGLLAVALLWDVPFEEAALGATESLKQRIDTIRRTGRLREQKGPAMPAPIPLPARAGPVLALAWKNSLGISRLPLRRLAAYVAVGFLVAFLVPRFEETRFLAVLVGFGCAFAAGIGTFAGPDTLRSDLRASLRGGADFLKTLPAPGWKVFLGEILAGPLVLIAIQGTLLAVAGVVARDELKDVGPRTLAWSWLAIVIALFPIDLLVFTIANGAAVLFPSWVQLGPQPERGAEAIGQNFLVGIVRYLLLMAGLLPAGALGGVVLWLGWSLMGLGPAALPLGALAAAAVLLGEVAILVHYLGGALERLDPSLELR